MLSDLKSAKLEDYLETEICQMTEAQQAWFELAPELLALWEACDTEQFHCCLGDIAEEALDALNKKAANMKAV